MPSSEAHLLVFPKGDSITWASPNPDAAWSAIPGFYCCCWVISLCGLSHLMCNQREGNEINKFPGSQGKSVEIELFMTGPGERLKQNSQTLAMERLWRRGVGLRRNAGWEMVLWGVCNIGLYWSIQYLGLKYWGSKKLAHSRFCQASLITCQVWPCSASANVSLTAFCPIWAYPSSIRWPCQEVYNFNSKIGNSNLIETWISQLLKRM